MFEKINQAHKTRAAFQNLRLHNISQTYEKIQEELKTPKRRDSNCPTPRSSLAVSPCESDLNDSRSSFNRISPLTNKDSKPFNFDSIVTDIYDENIFSKDRRKRKSPIQKSYSISLTRPKDRTDPTDEPGEASKNDQKKSRFSIFVKKESADDESSQATTPHAHPTLAFRRLFQGKLFQKPAQSLQRSHISSPIISPSKLPRIGDQSLRSNDVTSLAAHTFKGESLNLNESKLTKTPFSFSRIHSRNSSVTNCFFSPKESSNNKEACRDFGPLISPIEKNTDQSPDSKIILGKSMNKSRIQLSLSPEPTFANLINRANSEVAAIELGSPFQKKKGSLSLSINNFNYPQPFANTTKAERILKCMIPDSSVYSSLSQKTFKSPTPMLKKTNRSITFSKHNMFRVKPNKSHLSINFCPVGSLATGDGRSKKF